MVARKRDQVQAISGTTTAGPPRLSKTRSVGSLAAQPMARGSSADLLMGRALANPPPLPPSNSTSAAQKSNAKMRKVSIHQSIGGLWAPEMHAHQRAAGPLGQTHGGQQQQQQPPHHPRALPALSKPALPPAAPDVPAGSQSVRRPGSASSKKGLKRGSTHDLTLSATGGSTTPGLALSTTHPTMTVLPTPLPIDKGRPGSGGRLYPSQTSLHRQHPSTDSQPNHPDVTPDDADDTDVFDTLSNMSRSARTSIGSIASDVSNVSARSRRTSGRAAGVGDEIKALRKPPRRQPPAVKKRGMNAPLELPRWNTSTRAIVPIGKGKKGAESTGSTTNIHRSRSRDQLDTTAASRRDSKKHSHTTDPLPIGGELLTADGDDSNNLDPTRDAHDHASSHPSEDSDADSSDNYLETKYPVTPYQLDLFTQMCPTQDDLDSTTSLYAGPALFSSVGYHTPRTEHVHIPDLARAMKKVGSAYLVLKTRFYRNEKIVDADVEGCLDRREWRDVADDEVVVVVDTATWENPVSTAAVSAHVKEWMGQQEKFTHTFTALVFPTSNNGTYIVFALSLAVADTLSCRLATLETLQLYTSIAASRTTGHPDAFIDTHILDAYMPKERYDFIAFAYEMESKPTRHAMTYWRDQCVETVQDHVDPGEKKEMVARLERLERDKKPLRSAIEELRKRKAELEADVAKAVSQRRGMEVGDGGGSSSSAVVAAEPSQVDVMASTAAAGAPQIVTYQDPVTNELHLLSPETQSTILTTLLGDSTALPSSSTSSFLTTSITPLLLKHALPLTLLPAASPHTTLPGFAALTDATLTSLSVSPKDRRQLMALVEYVRNRIKECLMEQGKLKHALERRIAKLAREVDAVRAALADKVKTWEENEDWALRLRNLVDPPSVETRVAGVNLPLDAPTSTSSSPPDLAHTYAFEPLAIPATTLTHLRLFQTSYRASARIRRRAQQQQPSPTTPLTPSYSSTDDYDSTTHSTPTDAPPLGTRGHTTPSALATCLTAFAILLKHITGTDKFLVASTHSFRRNGLLIGPASDTLPIKCDLSKKGITFAALFAHMAKSINAAKRYGAACPSTSIAKHFATQPLTVAFDYIPFRDADDLARGAAHLHPADLTRPTLAAPPPPFTHLWCVAEPDPTLLRLTLVETATHLVGGFVYRTTAFAPETIAKWTGKYAAILDGVDPHARDVGVASIISRFYSTLWHGGGGNNSSSSTPNSLCAANPNPNPNPTTTTTTTPTAIGVVVEGDEDES